MTIFELIDPETFKIYRLQFAAGKVARNSVLVHSQDGLERLYPIYCGFELDTVEGKGKVLLKFADYSTRTLWLVQATTLQPQEVH